MVGARKKLLEVYSLRKLRLSAPMTLARSLSSSFVLASGGSLGRERPMAVALATFALEIFALVVLGTKQTIEAFRAGS